MTEPERLRFSVRDAVLFNPAISAGACRLYMALDSMSGPKGQCWPHQKKLAERLGVKVRALQYWLSELKAVVSPVHRRGSCIYVLAWSDRGKKPVASEAMQNFADLQVDAMQNFARNVGNILHSYNQAKESEKQASTERTDFREAKALLVQYPYAQHLPGSPSDLLVQRCLDLAGGLDGLADACRLMYRAGKKPARSWGWFPAVLQSYVRRRA